ncbi:MULTISPECIES: glutathione peroxidase [unclassified Mesobacillus]|jgi:glutathione peroxidase|uniref:glutathione peroxidase n=1 Tax=unclassified Mesobacillus TaxID=2675270 RepID=UPI00203C4A9B|nr:MULTISPECIES: glutathione peroxidase [unclassified Mesobacillus]MCM3122845.1 glutathione peroxidase [Mesobacillus sp. MER 33]MCM3233672.1 glutathione peroxidase [Mesobacillus sp. MER 48]
METVYDFTVKKANGDTQSLRDFEGKPMLIVNTASKCGLTPQFKGLQELYDQYQEKGLEILGFPCGQFNNQEYDNIDETTQFCQLNYGVTFPMFAKIDVNGANTDPLFAYLKEQKGGVLTKDIKWNFTKFLVDRKGHVVKRYAPTTEPEKIEHDLSELL